MNSLPSLQPSSKERVVVTGYGAVCAAGMNNAEILQTLRKGRDVSVEIDLFSTEGCRCRRACVLPDPHLENFRKRFPHTASRHRVSVMLAAAAHEALEAAGPTFVPDAVVLGTTSGAMSYGEQFLEMLRSKHASGQDTFSYRKLVREYVPQQAALDLISDYAWDVSPVIISNACASGTEAIGHGLQLLRLGAARRVLCGGYDALARLVFAGFESLRALSPNRCRPFDKNRSGLLLGEGAGVLCIERESDAIARNATPLVVLSGYGFATDNYHLTQPEPSGSGPLDAMRMALSSAGLVPSDVDYVNAHGTGTLFNDASEGRALLELLPGVPVSSTKGFTGHALGAAGAIEAVICCLALTAGFLPGNANLATPDPNLPLNLVPPAGQTASLRVALSNSVGFGGSNASVVFESMEMHA